MVEYTRTTDCELWAKKMIDNLGISQDALYLIEPSPSLPGANTLDKFLIPENGTYIESSMEFSHHFAVLHEGRFYDEHYPDGISQDEYLRRAVDNRYNEIRQSGQTWEAGAADVTR